MTSLNKALVTSVAILLGMAAHANETDPGDIAVGLLEHGLVEADRDYIMTYVAEGYIQHNPQAADGRAGLLGFVDFLETLDPPLDIRPVRVLAEGDLVMIQSEADFFGPRVIIDLFRFEDGMLAEHWDSIQEEITETASGRSMTDGPTEITDLDRTAENRALVEGLVTDVLMGGRIEMIEAYIRADYRQHNPFVADGRDGLIGFIGYLAENEISFGYTALHNVVAEGNFVFTQAEGIYDGAPTAFYDLWRVEDGMVVEHWDVVQAIPDAFAHDNGMF